MGTGSAIKEPVETGSPLAVVGEGCGDVAESETQMISGGATELAGRPTFCGTAALFSAFCIDERTLLEIPVLKFANALGACGGSLSGCGAGEATGIAVSPEVAFKAGFRDDSVADNGAERPGDVACGVWPNWFLPMCSAFTPVAGNDSPAGDSGCEE